MIMWLSLYSVNTNPCTIFSDTSCRILNTANTYVFSFSPGDPMLPRNRAASAVGA